MLRSGFGSKSSKSLSSMQGGISTSSDRAGGPDKVIRSLGGSDIKGWYDATDPRLFGTANDADLTFWYDKGPDQTHLHQSTAAEKPHYIHDGLNGRPVVRGDGSDDVYSTADAGGSTKTIDYGASCSVFILVKSADDDVNHGIFGADSDGVIVVPRECEEEFTKIYQQVDEKENQVRNVIRNSNPNNLQKLLREIEEEGGRW